jgi:hypothetical protein
LSSASKYGFESLSLGVFVQHQLIPHPRSFWTMKSPKTGFDSWFYRLFNNKTKPKPVGLNRFRFGFGFKF